MRRNSVFQIGSKTAKQKISREYNWLEKLFYTVEIVRKLRIFS